MYLIGSSIIYSLSSGIQGVRIITQGVRNRHRYRIWISRYLLNTIFKSQ